MNPFSWHWHRFFEWVHTLYAGHHYDRFSHHKDRALDHGMKADAVDVRRPAPGAGSEPDCRMPDGEDRP